MSNAKDEEKIKNMSPRNDPELNPCLEESIMSMKCLEQNQDNRDACKLYFENYKLCNKFWSKVKLERRRQGIEPELPAFEERKAVMDRLNKK